MDKVIELFKNPIVAAVLVTASTYCYMYYENQQKYKKNPNAIKKGVNIAIPAVVGGIVWILVSGISQDPILDNDSLAPIEIDLSVSEGGANMSIRSIAGTPKNFNVLDLQNVSDPVSSIVNSTPEQLPPNDVFIDVANFI